MDPVVEEIFKKHWKKLKKLPNVIGFDGKLRPRERNKQLVPGTQVFRVYVSKKVPIHQLKDSEIIPRKLKASNCEVEVDVVEIGEIKALSLNKQRHRPVKGGISTMHYQGTACTLNGFFRDKETGKILVASNNHCYAMENKAKKGDPVLQPAPYDGGILGKDNIGRYYKCVEIKFNEFTCPVRNFFHRIYRFFKREQPTNKVDIAFAELDVDYEVAATYIQNAYKGKRLPEEGEQVQKTGRTTEHTVGEVVSLHWNGQVQYSRGIAFFVDCILIKGHHFSQGGDSGSPVFDMEGNYIGALFAGSDEYTIVCKVTNIEEEAEVELITEEEK